MTNRLPDLYDEVPYPSLPRPQSHPSRIAALAAIAGMTPPPVTRWRVLEIGCGDACNLLPVAFEYPQGRFVGVDRAALPLARGRDIAAQLGLANLELHQADLLNWQPHGEFDYIIAHGFYSWVPLEIRDRLLALCATSLSPGGVAYVSYNALPGSHLRRYVWDLLKFHTRHAASSRVRIEKAHEVARLFAAHPADDPGRAAIRKEMENVLERGAEAIFHDDLAETNDPIYLMDFIGHAARHGLRYLGDAEPVRDDVRDLPLPVEDWFEARQYGDFLACRKFRESLLCRQEIPLDRTLSLDRFQPLAAASRVKPAEPQPDGARKFELSQGRSLTTNHPLVKDVLCFLAARWPGSVPVPALPLGGYPPQDAADMLMRLVEAEAIELWQQPPRVATAVAERPVASPLARAQLSLGLTMVTNQRHQSIDLPDEPGRALISLLDGARDRDALAAAMARVAPGPEGAPTDPAAIERSLEVSLQEMLRLCLLV
ncbi:MAG TPA: class I SAM-dependent methyltransferase [Bryobacteraceae bacterium]|nr:class I SAM-dependent methyltransferase [Bryobacteraceae bacterium]